jgi:hypothetical protein
VWQSLWSVVPPPDQQIHIDWYLLVHIGTYTTHWYISLHVDTSLYILMNIDTYWRKNATTQQIRLNAHMSSNNRIPCCLLVLSKVPCPGKSGNVHPRNLSGDSATTLCGWRILLS